MKKFEFLINRIVNLENKLCEKPSESNDTLDKTDMNPSEPTLNCDDCTFQTIS